MNTPAPTPSRSLVPCTADIAVAVVAATVFSASLLALHQTSLLLDGQLAGVRPASKLGPIIAYPVTPPALSLTPDVILMNRITVLFLVVSALLLAHALARLGQRLYHALTRT